MLTIRNWRRKRLIDDTRRSSDSVNVEHAHPVPTRVGGCPNAWNRPPGPSVLVHTYCGTDSHSVTCAAGWGLVGRRAGVHRCAAGSQPSVGPGTGTDRPAARHDRGRGLHRLVRRAVGWCGLAVARRGGFVVAVRGWSRCRVTQRRARPRRPARRGRRGSTWRRSPASARGPAAAPPAPGRPCPPGGPVRVLAGVLGQPGDVGGAPSSLAPPSRPRPRRPARWRPAPFLAVLAATAVITALWQQMADSLPQQREAAVLADRSSRRSLAGCRVLALALLWLLERPAVVLFNLAPTPRPHRAAKPQHRPHQPGGRCRQRGERRQERVQPVDELGGCFQPGTSRVGRRRRPPLVTGGRDLRV